MTTEREYLPCARCGKKTKRMFFVRGSAAWLFLGIAGVVIVVAAKLFAVNGSLSQTIGIIAGILLAVSSYTALFRIRCLECEPEWKEKIWGLKLK
jgi:hypothetical protein